MDHCLFTATEKECTLLLSSQFSLPHCFRLLLQSPWVPQSPVVASALLRLHHLTSAAEESEEWKGARAACVASLLAVRMMPLGHSVGEAVFKALSETSLA